MDRVVSSNSFLTSLAVILSRPAMTRSSRSALRPSAVEKLSILVRVVLNDSLFSEISSSNRRTSALALTATSRMVAVTSWVAAGSAMSVGSWPFSTVSGGASEETPLIEIEAMPVKPWKSRPTFASARIGTDLSTVIEARTWRGFCGVELEIRDLTDFDPVEKNRAPCPQTRYRSVEHNPIDCPVASFSRTREPIDEYERTRGHREHEETDQGVIGSRFHRPTLSSR